MEQNKVTNEREIELDRNSNREIQLDFVYPQIFDTNRQPNFEHNPSNDKDNNEDIIVVEEDAIDDKPEDKIEKETDHYLHNNIHEQIIPNCQPNRQLANLNLQQSNYPKSPENPSQPKNNSKKKFIFFEDIYKDILFFFINPIAGSHHGQLLIDMGVKKVEFLDNMKSSAYSAYIFNILDQENYQQGIALLKDYQERGKGYFYSFSSTFSTKSNYRRRRWNNLESDRTTSKGKSQYAKLCFRITSSW